MAYRTHGAHQIIDRSLTKCATITSMKTYKSSEEQRRKRRDYMREYMKRAPLSVVEKKRKRENEWHAANQEKTKAAKRKYQETHKQEIKERQNSPKAKALQREYRQSGKAYEVKKNNKSKSRGAKIANLSWGEWLQILKKFKHHCAYCKSEHLPVEQEHVMPLSRGGNHDKTNVVPSCRRCNLTKGIRTAKEWANDIGQVANR